MIHHLPQPCKSTQKSASSFRTPDSLGDNPLSIPHHGPPSAGSGTTKPSYASDQQPCPRFHSASGGKRQALLSRLSHHNMFHYMAAKTNPSQGLSLEASISSSAICTTKVPNILHPPGQTPHVLSAHSVPKGNLTAEILSYTKSCEVQRDGMLNGGTAGICPPCPCVSSSCVNE